jgi:hypothetical protein
MQNWHDVIVLAPGPGSGMGAVILIDGVPVRGVVNYKVEVGTLEPILVTVSFNANSVNRSVEKPSGTNQEAVPGAPAG